MNWEQSCYNRTNFFTGENSVNLLYDGKNFKFFESKKIDTKWNHGAGCTFSSSITAEISKGATVSEAVKIIKELISNALKDSFSLNNFAGPINHKKFLLKKIKKGRFFLPFLKKFYKKKTILEKFQNRLLKKFMVPLVGLEPTTY